MESETLLVEETKPLPVPESRWERLLYALIVVVLPVVCFSLSNVLKPEWQSGKFSDYAILMFLPEVAWFFFPFLVYAIVCLIILLAAPQRFASRFVVRFGIYTGVVLALQYVILVTATSFAILGVAAACFLILSKSGYGKVKPGWMRIGYFMISLVLIFITELILWQPSFQIQSLTSFFTGAPLGVLIAILASSPILCFAVMAATSVKLFKTYEIRPTALLWPATGLITWLAAYALAWRFSVVQAIEVYDSLPKEPPNCYIATASARGHVRIVHSKMLVTANGSLWVTTQLQVLKCAELALMVLAPCLHRWLRAVYDVVGYALAKRITNPFLADLAYLTLKPFEWAAALALKALVPEMDVYAGRLYMENWKS